MPQQKTLMSLELQCLADGAQHSTQADISQQAAAPQDPEEEEEYDPYAPLDPHAAGTLPIKPFKKGRKPAARRRPKEAEPLELGKLGESRVQQQHLTAAETSSFEMHNPHDSSAERTGFGLTVSSLTCF